MKEGIKLPEKFLPRPGLDARAEAEALRGALNVYSAHAGPLADHPMFGPLSRDEWTRLHCIHCAHHLSFVQPGPERGVASLAVLRSLPGQGGSLDERPRKWVERSLVATRFRPRDRFRTESLLHVVLFTE